MTEQAEITLNPDQQAVTLREAQGAIHALATLAEITKSGEPLSHEFVRNILAVSEFHLRDLCKTLGVETDGAAQVAERYSMLRAANERVRELEALLGNAQTPQATQASLKNLYEHLNRWWDLEGFGHISEVKFGPYVCEVKFSCMLFGAFRVIDSDTPMTDKERKAAWLESLQERGFETGKADGEAYIRDCDKSRATLSALFAQRLPSAKVWSFENRRERSGEHSLNDVVVYLHNIAEITTLPVPEKKDS